MRIPSSVQRRREKMLTFSEIELGMARSLLLSQTGNSATRRLTGSSMTQFLQGLR